MTLNKFRVRLVQGLCLLAALAIFLTAIFNGLSLLPVLTLHWFLILKFPAIVVFSYLCMYALTIHDVTYPEDHPLALFVMIEKERQGFFHHAEKHPEYRKKFGVYRLIGYKLKEV